MKAHRLLRSQRRAEHTIEAAAVRAEKAAERAQRQAEIDQIDSALHRLGRQRRAGCVSEQEFVAERQRLLEPVLEAPVRL